MTAAELIPADAPPLLRTAQLASYLSVSDNTIRNWAAVGLLPVPLRLSRRLLMWNTEEIRLALANLRQPREEKAHA